MLCTLLSYPHSTATSDIKCENFELSSGFRHSAGSLVIHFDPSSLDQTSIDGKTRYNVGCKMAGVATVQGKNVSYSGSRMSSMLGQMSVAEELVERSLMAADEIMRLARDEMLIFNAGHPQILL